MWSLQGVFANVCCPCASETYLSVEGRPVTSTEVSELLAELNVSRVLMESYQRELRRREDELEVMRAALAYEAEVPCQADPPGEAIRPLPGEGAAEARRWADRRPSEEAPGEAAEATGSAFASGSPRRARPSTGPEGLPDPWKPTFRQRRRRNSTMSTTSSREAQRSRESSSSGFSEMYSIWDEEVPTLHALSTASSLRHVEAMHQGPPTRGKVVEEEKQGEVPGSQPESPASGPEGVARPPGVEPQLSKASSGKKNKIYSPARFEASPPAAALTMSMVL